MFVWGLIGSTNGRCQFAWDCIPIDVQEGAVAGLAAGHRGLGRPSTPSIASAVNTVNTVNTVNPVQKPDADRRRCVGWLL